MSRLLSLSMCIYQSKIAGVRKSLSIAISGFFCELGVLVDGFKEVQLFTDRWLSSFIKCCEMATLSTHCLWILWVEKLEKKIKLFIPCHWHR